MKNGMNETLKAEREIYMARINAIDTLLGSAIAAPKKRKRRTKAELEAAKKAPAPKKAAPKKAEKKEEAASPA